MKLFKWILRLVFGTIFFMILYAIASLPLVDEIDPEAKHMTLVTFVWHNLLSVFLILLFYGLWLVVFEKRDRLAIFNKKIYTHIINKDLWLGFGIGFFYFVAIVITMMLLGYYKNDHISFDAVATLRYLTMMLVVAVGEEVIFRGIIHRMISERYNYIVALVISALIFGFVHISNPNATLWGAIAIAIEAGLMLGMAYTRNSSLVLPIGIHWAWNFTQGQVFGFAVSGSDAINSIIHPVISGPELITGGPFGAEASIIAVIYGLGLTYWLWKTKK